MNARNAPAKRRAPLARRLLILAAALCLAACTDAASARRVLTAEGYSGVRITGYRWFACGHDDTYATGFQATSLSGQQVSGVVCKAAFKASTVRVED